MKIFARIAKANNQICNIWDENNPLFEIIESDPVFDVEITNHSQLPIINSMNFYHSDGNFGEAPEGWIEPEPTLSELEQKELDRDEMAIDTLINQSKIISLLEGGGSV